MIVSEAPKRGTDGWGSGEFGASRGSRKHKGVDYSIAAGSGVYSPVQGKVTKLGLPYKDEKFRYVEVTDKVGNRHRIFYIQPNVSVGQWVNQVTILGHAQDVAAKYSTDDKHMKNHVHYEILDLKDSPINPQLYVV